jgi:hypothetical protein
MALSQTSGAFQVYELYFVSHLRCPSMSILLIVIAGPAGGVVGFARTSYDPLEGSPVVGFDMGGTVSSRVYVYVHGS